MKLHPLLALGVAFVACSARTPSPQPAPAVDRSYEMYEKSFDKPEPPFDWSGLTFLDVCQRPEKLSASVRRHINDLMQYEKDCAAVLAKIHAAGDVAFFDGEFENMLAWKTYRAFFRSVGDPEAVQAVVAEVESASGSGLVSLELFGVNALWWATYKNSAVTAQYLAQWSDIDARDVFFGRTPLYWAAVKHHNPELTNVLIDKGADNAIADAFGKTVVDHLREQYRGDGEYADAARDIAEIVGPVAPPRSPADESPTVERVCLHLHLLALQANREGGVDLATSEQAMKLCRDDLTARQKQMGEARWPAFARCMLKTGNVGDALKCAP